MNASVEPRLRDAATVIARYPDETIRDYEQGLCFFCGSWPHADNCDLLALRAALAASVEPETDRRLIDTTPRIGALTADIELELGLHRMGLVRCDCGDQIEGETYNHHVAAMVDYRLTATDGDA